MDIYRDIDLFAPPINGTAIALGRFDGVHRGHRVVLEHAVAHARSNGLMPVCFSFREETYARSEPHGCLTTDREKTSLIAELGIQTLLHPSFAPPLTDTEPDVFVNHYLIEMWNAKYITAGYDFHFGKNRAGDSALLKRFAGDRAMVDIIDPVRVDGEIVKSTKIRNLLREGNIVEANRLLGYIYSIRQRQVEGQHLGTKIGFPTLNFEWPDQKIMPPYGVYAVKVTFKPSDDQEDISCVAGAVGAAGFGLRPTVQNNRPTPILEVNLIDPDNLAKALEIPEIATRSFEIEFHKFIRREKKFESLDALQAQIGKDVETVREILENS
jgi:riboflavin kinase / FMN adenylyltransferase